MALQKRTVTARMELMAASAMSRAMKFVTSPSRSAIRQKGCLKSGYFKRHHLKSLDLLFGLTQDFPTFDGSRRGNLIRVSNRLVYNHPSHIQVKHRSSDIAW